jgi:hypothetical protein
MVLQDDKGLRRVIEAAAGSIDWQTQIVVGLHIVALVGWAIYLAVGLW